MELPKVLITLLLYFVVLVKSQVGIAPFISAGTDAKIEELPFLISIQQGTVHLCTGSLISEKFSLSSARILSLSSIVIGRMTIEYGSSIINPGNQDRQNTVGISTIVIHPNYNDTTQQNDIAIVEAESEIRLDGFYEPFAHLVSSGSRFSSGTSATHAGYGHISPNERNTVLQRANLQILSQSECIQAVGDTRMPFFNSICALDESVICAGDLGAPLLVNRVLVGVASFRNGDECINIPGRFPNVYTAVAFYIGWIENVTGINYRVNTFLSKN